MQQQVPYGYPAGYPAGYPQQPPLLRAYPNAYNAQAEQVGNTEVMRDVATVEIPYQPPAPPQPQRINIITETTTRAVPAPMPVAPPVVVPVVETCPPATCWSRKSSATIALNVLMFLMLVAVVILLFTVDLSTNQIADTALIAVTILFGAIVWYMTCECGATPGPNGSCIQVAAGCGGILD